MRLGRLIAPVRLGGIAACLLLVVGATAHGQPSAAKEEASRSVGDLTTRYHLIESYTAGGGEKAPAEAIGQYRVAIRETLKTTTERADAAPERSDSTVQMIFSERPAAVSANGAVTAVVRRYEAFRLTPNPTARPSASRPLEGLTIWFQPRLGDDPTILSLSADRGLKETEYAFATRQIFMPDLALLLPALPSRIGDRWRVPRTVLRSLLGERLLRGDPITATLQELRQSAKGPDWEAVIQVTGTRLTVPSGETSLNGRLIFTFAPPTAAEGKDAPGSTPDEGTMRARGAITEFRMAVAGALAQPGSNGRLQVLRAREVHLARQRSDPGPPLAAPEPPPTPTEANSWLTYDDPKGRFHFRHPQELRLARPPDAVSVDLVDERPSGPDAVTLQWQPKTGDPAADRRNRDPDFQLQTLKEVWEQSRKDVRVGKTGWLPDADWSPHKLKVHRIEAALLSLGPAQKAIKRVHLDDYLVLFARDESLVVHASTVQDPPLPFRRQVESILKTVRLGPASP